MEKTKIPDSEFKVQILGARCLVKELRNSEMQSGIMIPGMQDKQTNQGVVIATGDGAMLEDGTKVPMKVAPGDHVLYASFSGAPVKVSRKDDDKYLILNERDIYCIVSPA